MTTGELSTFIKKQALELGFDACGFAKADLISESAMDCYRQWLEGEHHAEMQYMEKHQAKRYDPRLLVEGCLSLIVVAINYNPIEKQGLKTPQIAKFAYGKDYHEILRSKLRALLQKINETGQMVHGRAFADSAPIAERYWASQAGLGWLGKNHHLIIPGKGSCFLLGELLVDIDLEYDVPLSDHCGKCRRCLDACPTNALDETTGVDSNHCLSYLTIEKRGPFNEAEALSLEKSNCLFGCDKCQDVCPWNRFATGNSTPEFQPKDGFLSMDRDDFEKMTEKDFEEFFGGTCLERTGYQGFVRNLKIR